MNKLQFEKEYKVPVYECGPDGKLNLYSLFDYMQDIASDHAEVLGFGRNDLMKENHFWVLSRIYAEISIWPKWEDTILMKTWPNGTDKMFAIRNFEASFPNGRHIVSGISSWLILDNQTRKIKRPDSALTNFNYDLRSNDSAVRFANKLEPAEGSGSLSSVFTVKVTDLDMNLHTNNARYLKWVNDNYDLDFIMNYCPLSVEINYLAESRYDDEIVIKTSSVNENILFHNHSIIRKNDDKELCRIRIGWGKNEKV